MLHEELHVVRSFENVRIVHPFLAQLPPSIIQIFWGCFSLPITTILLPTGTPSGEMRVPRKQIYSQTDESKPLSFSGRGVGVRVKVGDHEITDTEMDLSISSLLGQSHLTRAVSTNARD